MTAAKTYALDVPAALRLARSDALMPETIHHDVEKVLAAEVMRQRNVIDQYRTRVVAANRDLETLGFPPLEFPDGYPTCAGVKV